MSYLNWFIILVLILVAVCIAFVLWFGSNNGNGAVVIENNIGDPDSLVDGFSGTNLCSDRGKKCKKKNRYDETFCTPRLKGVIPVPKPPTTLLTGAGSGIQGPAGPSGGGGRLDTGIIPYSGWFHGFPVEKVTILGFATTNPNEKEGAEEKTQPTAEDDESQQKKEMLGSFWMNPTQQTLTLTSLQAMALTSSLIALPGTRLEIQVVLAAPGSGIFVPVGPPLSIDLSSVDNYTSFAAPTLPQDIPLSPGTAVALQAQTTAHIRGNLNIGAALAYV